MRGVVSWCCRGLGLMIELEFRLAFSKSKLESEKSQLSTMEMAKSVGGRAERVPYHVYRYNAGTKIEIPPSLGWRIHCSLHVNKGMCQFPL